jgi:hypothetical protein
MSGEMCLVGKDGGQRLGGLAVELSGLEFEFHDRIHKIFSGFT